MAVAPALRQSWTVDLNQFQALRTVTFLWQNKVNLLQFTVNTFKFWAKKNSFHVRKYWQCWINIFKVSFCFLSSIWLWFLINTHQSLHLQLFKMQFFSFLQCCYAIIICSFILFTWYKFWCPSIVCLGVEHEMCDALHTNLHLCMGFLLTKYRSGAGPSRLPRIPPDQGLEHVIVMASFKIQF